MTIPTVSEPIPIHLVSSRYLVHDANHMAHLRRSHNMTGVHIGGLPQAAQQNVFLGLPVELMPEEAALLVEKGAAYIVDDPAQHSSAFLANGLSSEEKQRFQDLLHQQGTAAAEEQQARAEARKDSALQRIASKTGVDKEDVLKKKVGNGDMDNWNDLPEDMLAPRPRGARTKSSSRRRGDRSASSSVGPSRQGSAGPPMVGSGSPSGPPSGARTPVGEGQEPLLSSAASAGETPEKAAETETAQDDEASEQDESLFASPPAAPAKAKQKGREVQPHGITPTTSYPPLVARVPDAGAETIVVPVPKSYPLYKHLNAKGYFLAPGLRFGCQYMAYAGDPLRYHSHFLCNGKEWDEEWDLMELVGGGRLGTGVKKGFLLGGVEKRENEVNSGGEGDVRTFVVEWAGM